MRFTRQYQVMAVPRARRQLLVTKWLVRQVRRRSSRVRRRIIWFPFIGYAPAYNPQVLCYVVVDTPHLPGEQQAHSTFASEIFSKIMAEVLPYKNVFPAGGAAQDLETNLSSQEEGIISGTATEDPNAAETPAETTPAPEGGWANYDEEFIDSGDEYSYPDTMGNVQDESAAVGNGETAGTGRDTGTADNAGETAASQEAQAAGD
mgnify:CR=1 FL=1